MRGGPHGRGRGGLRFSLLAGREREEEEEEDSQTDIASSEVKSSSRRQRKACSPSHPPDAKVQKVDEEQTPDSEVELTEGAEDSASGRGLPTDGYWCQYRLLCEQLPGREKQIEFLLTVLGKVSHLYLWEHTGHCMLHTGELIPASGYVYLWQQWYGEDPYN